MTRAERGGKPQSEAGKLAGWFGFRSPAPQREPIAAGGRGEVVYMEMIPAGEYDAMNRALAAANRGEAPLDAAQEYLRNWGVDSLVTLTRVTEMVGSPYGLKPLEGYRSPIVVPMPEGDQRVLFSVESKLKSSPAPQREPVLL